MPYIVKSSLDIGGKIIPWNEHEANKLIEEKKEKLSQKIVSEQDSKIEENASKVEEDAAMHLKNEKAKVESKKNKKREKAGEE